MPCDTINRAEAEKRERERQLKALEEKLKNLSARVSRVGNHISIEGWNERGGWCDECAISRLKMSQDFQVRTMVNNVLKQGGQVGVTFGHGH